MTNGETMINDNCTAGDKNFQNSDQENLLALVKHLYSSLKDQIQLEYEMLAKETECCLQNKNPNENDYNKLSGIDIILLNADLEKLRSMSTLARNKLNKLLNDETLVNTKNFDEHRKFELTMDLIDSMERRLRFVCNERKKVYKKCCEMKEDASRRSRNRNENDIHSQTTLESCISSPFTDYENLFTDRNERENYHDQTLPNRISFTNTDRSNSLFDTNENENRHSEILPSQSLAMDTSNQNLSFDTNESENVYNSSINIGNKRQSTDANPRAFKRSNIIDQEIKSEPLEDEGTNENIELTERLDPAPEKCLPGFVNLERLGRTCYMNSVVQCLNSINLLKKYFIHRSYLADTNASIVNAREAKVARELARLIEALSKTENKTISPKDFKTVVGEFNRQFANLDQQDAHEFLTFLLDKIHEELSEESNTQPEESWSKAKITWYESLKNRKSIISDLFFGQTRMHASCTQCSYTSIIYNVFKTLIIPLPNAPCGMQECITKYLNTQRATGWNCPICKNSEVRIRKIDFMRLPPVLIIQVGRFTEKDGWHEKKLTKISAQMHKFTLNKYLVRNSGIIVEPYTPLRAYNLCAIVRHLGVNNGGTYEAVCKHNYLNKCIKYCNEGAYESTFRNIEGLHNGNYILFYQSKNVH